MPSTSTRFRLHMDRFTEIESLIAAIDHGSLAAAAARAGVTPAMLGRRVDSLEKRLGTKLLHRTTRRLVLTEQGNLFVERARRLLQDLEQTEREAAGDAHRATGHLVVSAPAGFGRQHVGPHACDFLKQHPQLRMSCNFTDRVVDLVREGYDMAIRIGGELDPNYVAVRLASNRRVVCGTPEYFREHGTPQTPEDLLRHNCLAFNTQGGQPRGWKFRVDGKEQLLRVQGTMDCNDGEMLKRWVREGHGLGWRSTWEIAEQLKSGELVTCLDDFALPAHDILAIYPYQRNLPAKVRFFIEYLKQIYANGLPGNGRETAAPLLAQA